MKKITYILILSAFIASISLLVYLYPDRETYLPSEETLKNQNKIASSTTKLINLGEGVVAEFLDSNVSTTTLAKINMATLDRPITSPANAVYEIFKKNEVAIKNIVSLLKNKPETFDKWIELGIYRKMIEDYSGAKEAWENALILNPKNALPLSNIANLYGYYLKNNVKAEEYYLASIKTEPNSGFWYYQTFLFYTEVMNDPVKAKNIIAEGLKNNPEDSELKDIFKSL